MLVNLEESTRMSLTHSHTHSLEDMPIREDCGAVMNEESGEQRGVSIGQWFKKQQKKKNKFPSRTQNIRSHTPSISCKKKQPWPFACWRPNTTWASILDPYNFYYYY